MYKYFKNENKVTPDSLFKEYENYIWHDFPQLHYQREKFYRLFDECEETDEYQNYKKEFDVAKKKAFQLQREINEIEEHRERIIIMNSEEEYDSVLNKLKSEYCTAWGDYARKKDNPPKDKRTIFKPIFDAISEQELKAYAVQKREMRDQESRCTCCGSHCEC